MQPKNLSGMKRKNIKYEVAQTRWLHVFAKISSNGYRKCAKLPINESASIVLAVKNRHLVVSELTHSGFRYKVKYA